MSELNEVTPAVILRSHDCGDPDCSRITIILKGASMIEDEGELMPAVVLEPESCFDLIALLSQALKARIMVEED